MGNFFTGKDERCLGLIPRSRVCHEVDTVFFEKIMLMKMHLGLAMELRENSVELNTKGLDQVDGIMNLYDYKLITSKYTL